MYFISILDYNRSEGHVYFINELAVYGNKLFDNFLFTIC